MSKRARAFEGKKTGEYEAIQLMINERLLRMSDFLLENDYSDVLGESIGYFYGLENDSSYSFIPSREILFLGWLLFDCFDDNERLIADDYIATWADFLRPEEMNVCYGLRDTYMTCLCVQKKTKHAYFFKDMFLGDDVIVPREYLGSVNIPKGGVLFTRVMRLFNEFFFVGAGLVIDKRRGTFLAEDIQDKFNHFCDIEEKISFRDFLKRNGELLHWEIRGIEVPEPKDEPERT